MGVLYDRIIDEAEEAGTRRVLGNDPYDSQICELVSDIVGVNITPETIGGNLAIAAYRKYEHAADVVEAAKESLAYAISEGAL